MTKPYSIDLRERVVFAVEYDGMSRHQAAAQFGVAVSSAIRWVARFRKTGSVVPAKIGGYKPKTLRGGHAEWLMARCQEKDFTISQLVVELQTVRGLKADRHSVWAFLHAHGLSYKKKPQPHRSKTGRTSKGGGSSGVSIRAGSMPNAWFSLMKPGLRPTWRRFGDGVCAGSGSREKPRLPGGKR